MDNGVCSTHQQCFESVSVYVVGHYEEGGKKTRVHILSFKANSTLYFPLIF